MTKKSKLGISLSTLAATAAPLGFAISCGTSTNYDLKVGIRPEDAKLWQPVVKQFEKATGKKVKLIFVADQIRNYTLWHSSGSIPDVTLSDSGAANEGMRRGWFQELNLKDIFENKDYKIKLDDDWAERDLQFNSTNFETAMMNVNILRENNNYSSASVIYGPKITYAWKTVPSKTSGEEINLFDGSKTLKWYVPNKTGNGLDEASWTGQTAAESPLRSLKDGHVLKNTVPDIQEFLSRAISANDLKFNQAQYNASSLTNNDPKKRVIATGMPGYLQRIQSVGKVLYDYAKAAGNVPELKIGSFRDNAISYANIALGKGQYQTTQELVNTEGTNLDDKSKLDDTKVFSGVSNVIADDYKMRIDKNLSTSPSNMTELEVINYLSVFGYNGTKASGSSGVFDQNVDSQVGFGKREVLLLPNGALWQKNSIYEKIKDKLNLPKAEDAAGKLVVFSQPVQETGVDGYSISSKAKGDRLLLAKKFLRFLFQKKAAAAITGTKAISTLKAAQDIQPPADASVQNAIANAGTKWFVENEKAYIQNIPWNIAKSTYNSASKKENTKAIYDNYNDLFMKGAQFNGPNTVSPTQALEKIKAYNIKYLEKIDI